VSGLITLDRGCHPGHGLRFAHHSHFVCCKKRPITRGRGRISQPRMSVQVTDVGCITREVHVSPKVHLIRKAPGSPAAGFLGSRQGNHGVEPESSDAGSRHDRQKNEHVTEAHIDRLSTRAVSSLSLGEASAQGRLCYQNAHSRGGRRGRVPTQLVNHSPRRRRPIRQER